MIEKSAPVFLRPSKREHDAWVPYQEINQLRQHRSRLFTVLVLAMIALWALFHVGWIQWVGPR